MERKGEEGWGVAGGRMAANTSDSPPQAMCSWFSNSLELLVGCPQRDRGREERERLRERRDHSLIVRHCVVRCRCPYVPDYNRRGNPAEVHVEGALHWNVPHP